MLTRIFGLKQIEIAEDIVQETLIDALNQWSMGQLPHNPSGWLLQVAKYKTINLLRRDQRTSSYVQDEKQRQNPIDEPWEDLFQEEQIGDSQLRMIFTCCHPALPVASQIALTLKTLCGFSVPEIAHTLLTTIANINKRLYRAKEKFRQQHIQFALPPVERLGDRLDAVYLALYLLFNEGYNSSHHDALIREDLCVDAIRLATLVGEYYSDQPKIYALLALMYFHGARFDARLDKHGGIVIFEDQDRSKWDREMIQTGVYYLNKAATGEMLSAYHLEAGIAATHCLAPSIETTDWQSIYRQYELLYALKPNPVVELNMAIISSRIDGIGPSIDKLLALEAGGKLAQYNLLSSTLGHFFAAEGKYDEAAAYIEKALSLTHAPAEVKLLEQKLTSYRHAAKAGDA